MRSRFNSRVTMILSIGAVIAAARIASQAQGQAQGRGAAPPTVVAPTFANLEYAPASPANSEGHRLDLYIPRDGSKPRPVVIWTAGSAWRQDTGKRAADRWAERLNPAGFAVAGVSIRSSQQVKFPGQLHDIKAAIRWLRANASKYDLDPNRIAVMGDSSGGWTTAMAAVTGDVPELEGSVGTTSVSSRVQAAVAFYPPTNFLTMDAWAIQKCAPANCHDNENSPESQLVGCAIQSCADKVQAANPLRYISDADPPIMILHGNSDPLVPHNQGEQFYMALNKACHDAVFISLPKAGHGPWAGFLSDDAVREAATRRSTTAAGCSVTNPTPYTPTWNSVIEFLNKYLRG